MVDWSPQTMQQRLKLEVFEQRWKALAPSAATPDPRAGGLSASGLRGGAGAVGALDRRELEAESGVLCRSDAGLGLPSSLAAAAVLRSAAAGDRRPRQADPGYASGCPGKSDRYAATVCSTGHRLPGPGRRAHQNGWRRRWHRNSRQPINKALQQALPAAVTALTEYRTWLTTKLPGRSQRHGHWTRQLHLLPAQGRAAALHTGAITGYEPAGVEPIGRV